MILLDEDTRQRARGTMVGLQPNGWTLKGMQRYDVLMLNMQMVPYQDVAAQKVGCCGHLTPVPFTL